MKCPECSSDNREGAKFCNECGHKLEVACPKCTNVNRPGSKFCDECGQDLSQPFTATKPSKPPESYQISTDTEESLPLPKGERRQATIIFSDLSGYTAMNEKLDPEEVEEIMGQIKEGAVRIVESYGGIVNQFVGDEILALFGIPKAHEDDPLRAVKSALELHDMVRKISQKVENRIGKPLTMHTGINTGLIVTNLRDDRDGLYGITGETVNTGARLKSQAEPDEVLVTSNTQKLIAPYFEMIKLEETKMKGKAEPTLPFRVIGVSKIHSRIEASEQKGFTTYTGRDQEMTTLHTCLEKAVQGQGQFATVVGEAGVGKSRLHYEFRHSLDRKKITVLQGRCQSYGSDIPYLPFVNALHRGLYLRDEHSPAELLENAINNIKAIDPSLEQFLPLYLHLLSIESDYSIPAHLQGKELRKAMEEALAVMITLNTQHQPMVLILEDWHWSDDASQSALNHLIGVISPFPLMVLVTYRPNYTASWGYLSYHTPVVLKSLDALHTENIIKSIIKSVTLPKGLWELIHERSDGNPLFIEELCYSLIEESIVVVKNGQAILTQSLENLSLPNTVQAIIRNRLDRLDNDTRETLRIASVLGRVFPRRILERMYKGKVPLTETLETLKAVEVIYQVKVLPEAEYSFKHVLTQKVVYETLLLKRREELHGDIGQAIEDLHPERLKEQSTILAYHYSLSNRQEKATEYALIAGDHAASLYASTEATTYYEKALAMAQDLPVSPKSKQWQIEASLKLASVGITRQDIERDRKNLEEAKVLAEELNDETRLTRVLYWLGRIHYVLWNPQIAIEYAKQSLEIADQLKDDVLAAPPVNLMGRVYWQLSNFTQASQMMERSIEQMRKIGNRVEESTASALTGYLLAFLGEFDRAIIHGDYGIHLAQEIQNPFTEANAHHLRGCICDQRGEWSEAIKYYQDAIEIAEKADDLFRLYLVKSWKGKAYAMAGDPERGRVLLEESLALAEQIGTKFWLAWQKTALTACLFALKEFDVVLPLCQEAIRLGEETNDKYVVAFANRTLAEILSIIEPLDFEMAEQAISKAIKIQLEINVKPELARSYVSYTHLLLNMGNQKEAREYIIKTFSMFKKMGMTWDLNQAEQLLRSLEH